MLGNDGGTLGGEEGEGEGERVMGGEDSSPPALAREEGLVIVGGGGVCMVY